MTPQKLHQCLTGTRKSSRLATKDDNPSFYIERSFNFKTKEESARLMPKGFEPPVDDENGIYISGEEYTQELLDEIANDKVLRDTADIVLKGEKWHYVDDEEMLFNNETNHSIHGIFVSEWVACRKNGYTYLKKTKRDNPPFFTIFIDKEN